MEPVLRISNSWPWSHELGHSHLGAPHPDLIAVMVRPWYVKWFCYFLSFDSSSLVLGHGYRFHQWRVNFTVVPSRMVLSVKMVSRSHGESVPAVLWIMLICLFKLRIIDFPPLRRSWRLGTQSSTAFAHWPRTGQRVPRKASPAQSRDDALFWSFTLQDLFACPTQPKRSYCLEGAQLIQGRKLIILLIFISSPFRFMSSPCCLISNRGNPCQNFYFGGERVGV
jgi:hypothetical protein